VNRRIALPLAATLAAMASFQAGASVAARGLFPAVGAEGAAALRLAFGAAILMAIVRPWRRWPRGAPIGPVLALGVSMAATILLFYLALSRIPQGVAIALQFLGPLAVAIAGSRRAPDFLWAALAAGGVWLLAGAGRSGTTLDPLGVVFALGAASGWGAYILLGRAASATFGSSTAALTLSVAALVALPVGLWRAGPALFSPGLLPLALAVAVLAAALPFSLELYALPRLPARTFAVFTSLEPALGVVSGFVLLHQQLAPAQLAGVACVMTAAAGAAWSSARGGAHAVAEAPAL
jgi:inner membrane transporter RhtA